MTTIVRKILEALATPVILKGQEIFGSASVGIALYPMDGENEESLLKNADTAM